MKGISSRVTKALPTQAKLDCADNTGAKVVQPVSYTHLTLPTTPYV